MSEQQELPLFLTGSDLLPPVLFRYALTDRILFTARYEVNIGM
jgi:hypothetical protein